MPVIRIVLLVWWFNTEEELNAAYQKGRRVGQVEGMITYQKRLVENLQKDNASLNQKLAEIGQE